MKSKKKLTPNQRIKLLKFRLGIFLILLGSVCSIVAMSYSICFGELKDTATVLYLISILISAGGGFIGCSIGIDAIMKIRSNVRN